MPCKIQKVYDGRDVKEVIRDDEVFRLVSAETVKGKYDLNSCYCTILIKIYNNSNETLLLDYSENRVKVLVPENKSAEETITMCINEVMKRVKRNLPNKMKKMNL